jgi:hypothetical protein
VIAESDLAPGRQVAGMLKYAPFGMSGGRAGRPRQGRSQAHLASGSWCIFKGAALIATSNAGAWMYDPETTIIGWTGAGASGLPGAPVHSDMGSSASNRWQRGGAVPGGSSPEDRTPAQDRLCWEGLHGNRRSTSQG